MEKFLGMVLSLFKEKFLGVLLGVFVLGLVAIMVPAQGFTQGFYVGGYSDQGQWMMNNGVIVGETMWQNQTQMQQTVLGIENMPIAEVNSYMSGYMEQAIGDNCSMAYTETGNSSYYGISIDASGVSAGASAGSYAFSATTGDARGTSDAWSDITITILP